MRKNWLKITLYLYVISLAAILFLFNGSEFRENYFSKRIASWVPFESTYQYFHNVFLYPEDFRDKENLIMDLAGNLLLLFPWGLLAPLVFKKLNSVKALTLSAFLISLMAELIQFVFKIGVLDVDDIIYNTFGAFLGYKVLKLLHRKVMVEY